MSEHPSRRGVMRGALACVIALTASLGLSSCYRVALFGDVPYKSSQEPAYQRLIGDVNDDAVAFSTHVGDFQASSSTCTDATVTKNIGWFDSFDNPLIYTPGDNEWTDCNDPTGRLARLRQLVFRDTGATSRGRAPRTLTPQAGYPENSRWTHGAVTYVTMHVVGSSDGKSNLSEWQARRTADIAWLRAAFAASTASNDKAIVVIAHSGLRFERAEGGKGAYESIFTALRDETVAYPGQVLYVHGDGHTFTDDRPMRTAAGASVPNFRRLEVYGGTGTVRWIRLTVDDTRSDPFSVSVPPQP